MPRFILTFAAVTVALVFSLPAQAAGSLVRTFVSSAGVDSNPCTVMQPCATFAAAYAAVAPNGIVAALDPGKYGPLNIGGPVTIDGNGWAAITVPSAGIGINVNAGPTDKVILTGLTIDGAGGGIIGIAYNGGAALTIENCVVRNVGTIGLQFNAGNTTPQALSVSDSYFLKTNNTGVDITATSSGAVMASFKRTEFNNNGNTGLSISGVFGSGAVNVAVTDSIAANNSWGVHVSTTSSQSIVNATLTHSLVVGNVTGIGATGANATLWLARSTLTGNAGGYGAGSGGVINSYGDNYITDTNNGGSLTPVNKQ